MAWILSSAESSHTALTYKFSGLPGAELVTDKVLFNAFLEVASHYTLRTAAAAARSGCSIDEAVCWRRSCLLRQLLCMLGLALALLTLWRPRKRRRRRLRLSLS